MEKRQERIKTLLNKIGNNFRIHCQQAKFSIIMRLKKRLYHDVSNRVINMTEIGVSLCDQKLRRIVK